MSGDVTVIAGPASKAEVTAISQSPIILDVVGNGPPLVVTPVITKEVIGEVHVTVHPPQVVNVSVDAIGQVTVAALANITNVSIMEGGHKVPPPFRCCGAEETPYTNPGFPLVSAALDELFRLAALPSVKLPIPATAVSYTNSAYPTVQAVLDKLLYVAPAITSFDLSVGTVEVGSVVMALTASWGFNKAMVSATLTDATITPLVASYSFLGLNLTTSKSYTLACSDGTNSASLIRTVSFSHKRYWGVSPNTALTDAQILSLPSEFSSSKSKALTYNCSGGNYFYFCYPAALGTPVNVAVGGLAFSDFTVTQQSFTNSSGNTALFNVVRCNLLQTGSAINVSWN